MTVVQNWASQFNNRNQPRFWTCYDSLPGTIQNLTDKNYNLLKSDARHASLHFKKIGQYYAVRIGLYCRALGIEVPDGVLWFWIGTHADYDRITG